MGTYKDQIGNLVRVAHAPNWTDNIPGKFVRVGLTNRKFINLLESGMTTKVAEWEGIVFNGLKNTHVIYQGLKRDMKVGDRANCDKDHLALVCQPEYVPYYEKQPGKDVPDPTLKFKLAPKGLLFAVLITVNHNKTTYEDIHYWANSWSWVDADATDRLSPTSYDERYEKCVFRKEL